MRCLSNVIVGGVVINFYQVFAFVLCCDKALTGETLHSVKFLFAF